MGSNHFSERIIPTACMRTLYLHNIMPVRRTKNNIPVYIMRADFITITQGVKTGVIDIIAVNLHNGEVLFVSLLIGQGAILWNHDVHRYGLLEPVVGHSAQEVTPARYSAAFALLRRGHTRQNVAGTSSFKTRMFE